MKFSCSLNMGPSFLQRSSLSVEMSPLLGGVLNWSSIIKENTLTYEIFGFLFFCHFKSLLSLPPPLECLCTGWHLRALAGIKISGSLKSGPGAQTGWLVCPVTHTQEPREQPKIVFLQQESIFWKTTIGFYTQTCLQLHTHTHTQNCG